MNLNKNINKKAFTVAEMMIAMMIAMIVLAAASPIITKRGFSSFSLNTLPIGTIIAWASQDTTTPPPNWCFCNGTGIDQKTYPDLYNMLGTSYDPATTSHLFPDLRGRTIAGGDSPALRLKSNNTVGSYGGNQYQKLTDFNQLPSHTHTIASAGDHNHTTSTDGAHDHGGTISTDPNHDHGGVTTVENTHIHSISYGTASVWGSAGYSGCWWGNCSMGQTRPTVASIAAASTSQYNVAATSHNHSITVDPDHTHNTSASADHNHGGTSNLGGYHNHGGNTQPYGNTQPDQFSIVKPFIAMQYIIKCK